MSLPIVYSARAGVGIGYIIYLEENYSLRSK